MIKCKNCEHEFEGKYCNNCGQKADTPRINAHYLWHEIQHGIFHVDKGVLYTVKELFIRPGFSVKEYIQGKRINHFKPIAFVFIMAGILGLLRHYLHINTSESIIENNNHPAILETFIKLGNSNLGICLLILLPFYALSSRIAFWKSSYNFFEHLILNAFLFGQLIIIRLLLLPIALIDLNELNRIVNVGIGIIFIALLFLAYFQFFNKSNAIKTIFKTILTFVIFSIEIIIILFLINL